MQVVTMEDELLRLPNVVEICVIDPPESSKAPRKVFAVLKHGANPDQFTRAIAEINGGADRVEVRFLAALPRKATGAVSRRAIIEAYCAQGE